MLTHDLADQLAVYADPQMVDMVIRNLLSNALKFMQAGGTITVSAILRETDVQTSGSDTGIGIPHKQIPNLFRIDTKYKRAGTAGEQGTGLGLILSDFIMRRGKYEH